MIVDSAPYKSSVNNTGKDETKFIIKCSKLMYCE